MAGAAYAAGVSLARLGRGNLPRSVRAGGGGRRSTLARSDVPCDWLCAEFGWLEPPAPCEGGARTGACPHCGAHAWADLRDGAVVDALAEVDALRHAEDEGGTTGGGVVDAIVGLVFLGLACIPLMTIGSLLLGGSTPPGAREARPLAGYIVGYLLLGAFASGCLAAAMVFGRRALGEIRRNARATHPTRWRYHAASADGLAARLEGPLAGANPLRAPLSDRACAAWWIGVRTDGEHDAPAWSWAAIVSEAAELRVEGQELPTQVALVVEPRAIARPQPGTADAARVDAWLRGHGMDPSRLDWLLYEDVFCAGDEVAACVRGAAAELCHGESGQARLTPRR